MGVGTWLRGLRDGGSRAGAVPERFVATAERVLDADAASVSAFLADPANTGRLSGGRHLGFAVPGRPAGVGARHVVVVRGTGTGALLGTVREVTEHHPGRRFATRELADLGMARIFTLDPVVGGTHVRYERVVHVAGAAAALVREGAPVACADTLAWLDHHLAGGPPPPHRPPGRERRRLDAAQEAGAWAHAQRAVAPVAVRVAIEVPVPPLRAWAVVADPQHGHVWALGPDAVGFAAPGAAPGRPGAMHCLVQHLGPGLVATFAEVLEAERGHRLVLRDRSDVHANRTTLTVDATPRGSRIVAEVTTDAHDDGPAAAAVLRRRVEVALDGYGRVLATAV